MKYPLHLFITLKYSPYLGQGSGPPMNILLDILGCKHGAILLDAVVDLRSVTYNPITDFSNSCVSFLNCIQLRHPLGA